MMKSAPAKKMPVAKVLPKPMAVKPSVAPAAKKTESSVKKGFKVSDYVVYPTHGVGKITAEETQKIGDLAIRVFVMSFEKDKMTLRVPVHRAAAAGLRSISSMDVIEQMYSTLKSRARTSRGMWSRRAQEYEAKINSGSLISVAEVVRDLHKNVDQAERSYSERMIYESAMGRLIGEVAVAHKIDSKAANDKLLQILKKQQQAAIAA